MPGLTLDPFKDGGFHSAELTDSINELPHKPGRLGSMGIFAPRPVTSKRVWIEKKAQTLKLLTSTERGGPASLHNQSARNTFGVNVPHYKEKDSILADDLIGVRAMGQQTETERLQTIIQDHQQEIVNNFEVMMEYLRIGAVHGLVLDGDGTTELLNLFEHFGVAEQTVDFIFSVATTDIRGQLSAVKRLVENEFGAESFDHVHGIAGDAWWDAYQAHADVRESFDRWQNGQQRQLDARFTGFDFAGVIIENYRGSIGGTAFVDTDQCRFFAVGTNSFVEIMAPADWNEMVGTRGRRLYSKQKVQDWDTGVDLQVQMNVLPMSYRPASLIKGTKS